MKDISLGKIVQIAVMVHDLERATAFYRDTLGLKFLFNAPPQMAFFDCEGIRLMIGVPERADLAHASSILYFQVPDIDQAYEMLSGRGVIFEGKPALVAPMQTYDLWLAEFRDSENNVLALMCEKPK
jgi:predicted enzyme related to lactoylglutathione lyase